ncbi:MAG: NADH-quinone oxidoreductase subunit G [Xanthomonadales bacterium PRO6]|nr:NADH-quinone oxidoreductase chain 3 [Xanthomonadales bacterium]MCE7930878.1 NADH-quinone oxidoreductase subunit G [Xanthomonadales bacterium PRO6]
MSAQPSGQAAPDHVNIEIDGTPLQAPKGSMIISAADKAGIPIPRFCYHEKLAIAANCRMCLVDVEKAPKPMPACATPVMEGMKVYTRSKRALDSQRNVMEFLLVNHPLDCPICDQGGECELQDLAMGYGRSVSRFSERKRVVADEDLGPLVATEMTRCIHCTRCVRFMDDIAGTTELGGMFRGEHTEIGSYIGRSLKSELSGNIIDLCPVGALTNKVFRFRARPWELIARESIGYHDALGSNLYLHLRRGEVLRTVPRDHEDINENWLSDRDRYSHQGLTHTDRLSAPRIRRDGVWVDASWEEALKVAADGLRALVSRHGADALVALVGPGASAEEMYLLQALARGLGSANVEHRLQQLDFSDDATAPIAPGFAAPLAGYSQTPAALLIGAHPRHDAPLLGHRIRRAWKHGAQIHAINPLGFEHHFGLGQNLVGNPEQQLADLAAVAAALATLRGTAYPAEIQQWSLRSSRQMEAGWIAQTLHERAGARVLFGDHAVRHPAASALRRIARFIAVTCGASFDEMPQGANGAAAWRVGCVPHRGPGGASVRPGTALPQALSGARGLLLHAAEIEDCADGSAAAAALQKAEFVLAFAAYTSPALAAHAQVLLPIGLAPEIDGSYVNVDGRVQTLAAAAKSPGDARPGWRVLRALGAALNLPGFEFVDFAALHAVIAPLLSGGEVVAGAAAASPSPLAEGEGLIVQQYRPIYRVDAVLRRSPALQSTVIGEDGSLRLHPEDALALGIGQGGEVSWGGRRYSCTASAEVPRGVCRVATGFAANVALPVTGQRIVLEQVRHG